MSLRRFAILSAAVMGLGFLNLYSLPVRAQEGELFAQDSQAQINLRSLANTQADIVAAGTVGERAQILGYSKAEDGLVWYRIKLVKSGQVGWVRGDLLKVLGAKPKSAKSTPTTAAKTTPVALTPPKTSASMKSAALVKPPVSKSTAKPTKPIAEPKRVEPKTADTPKTAAAAPSAEPTVTSPAESNDPPTAPTTTTATIASTTIVSFETPSYAVRVFSQSGQLRLNLFNRKTSRIALRSAPVQSKSSADGTTYSYITNDLQVNVMVPETGQPTVMAIALGETLKEQPEVVASPEPTPVASPSPTSITP